MMATECDISWTLVGQAAQGARDKELPAVVRECGGETAIQLKWLKTRMKEAAPQALVVARRERPGRVVACTPLRCGCPSRPS